MKVQKSAICCYGKTSNFYQNVFIIFFSMPNLLLVANNVKFQNRVLFVLFPKFWCNIDKYHTSITSQDRLVPPYHGSSAELV